MDWVTLCHKPGRCCPTFTLSDSAFTLRDDDGNKVTISRKHFDILKQKIKNNEL